VQSDPDGGIVKDHACRGLQHFDSVLRKVAAKLVRHIEKRLVGRVYVTRDQLQPSK